MIELERGILAAVARGGGERWYTGRITALNADGSYHVLCQELNVIVPRVFRSGADRRRLLPGDRVQIRARGAVWELA